MASASDLRGIQITYEGKTLNFRTGNFKIGRSVDADVKLPELDREVSRVHAVLNVTATGVTVEDRSQNGTFVNGSRIAGIQPLSDRDELRCGATSMVVNLLRG